MNRYIAKEKQGAWLIIKILIATSVFLLICSRASSMILKTYGDDSDILDPRFKKKTEEEML